MWWTAYLKEKEMEILTNYKHFKNVWIHYLSKCTQLHSISVHSEAGTIARKSQTEKMRAMRTETIKRMKCSEWADAREVELPGTRLALEATLLWGMWTAWTLHQPHKDEHPISLTLQVPLLASIHCFSVQEDLHEYYRCSAGTVAIIALLVMTWNEMEVFGFCLGKFHKT